VTSVELIEKMMSEENQEESEFHSNPWREKVSG
jgi:hypothetical protein